MGQSNGSVSIRLWPDKFEEGQASPMSSVGEFVAPEHIPTFEV